MLLSVEYEHVEHAFGGNLDPTRGQEEESQRLHQGFFTLLEKHHRGVIQLSLVAEAKCEWCAKPLL